MSYKANQAIRLAAAALNPLNLFRPHPRHEGVRRINIYLLRLTYGLMFFVLGRITWTTILTHQGAWDPTDAVNWCAWSGFATLAGLGLIRPLKMLPILLLEVFYKVQWLIIVAYPLLQQGKLAGSPAENIFIPFAWVVLPILAMPWGYAFVTYVYKPTARTNFSVATA